MEAISLSHNYFRPDQRSIIGPRYPSSYPPSSHLSERIYSWNLSGRVYERAVQNLSHLHSEKPSGSTIGSIQAFLANASWKDPL
jgi:hypothetical protein